MTRFKPLHLLLTILLDPKEKDTKIIGSETVLAPDDSSETMATGVVRAVGPSKVDDSDTPILLKPGDRVVLARQFKNEHGRPREIGWASVMDGDTKVALVHYSDVLGVIEEIEEEIDEDTRNDVLISELEN